MSDREGEREERGWKREREERGWKREREEEKSAGFTGPGLILYLQ